MGETGDLTAAVARVEAGPGRFVIPVASGTFLGAGVESMARALSEPFDPDDFPPLAVDPAAPLINRFVSASLTLWARTGPLMAMEVAELAVLTLQYEQTMNSLLTNPTRAGNYLEAVGTAYSDYVRDYFKGYLDLLVGAFDALKTLGECQMSVLDFTVAEIFSTDPAVFDQKLVNLTAECSFLLPVLQGFVQINAFHQKLLNEPLLVIGAALELVAEVSVLIMEKLADLDVAAMLGKYVSDEVAIGEIHGLLIGVVIADVIIDELLTAGAGKAFRGIRTLKFLP